MHTFQRFRARSAGALLLAMLAFAGSACSGRGATVPDLSGDVVDVIVQAALDDAAASGPLQVDSVSFGRLGTLIGDAVLTVAELDSSIRRDVEFVDPADVLDCPSRRPCRLAAGGVYVTVWDAALDGDVLSVTVSRVRNVERLYTMTQHETWNLQLRRTGSTWRLTAREPII